MAHATGAINHYQQEIGNSLNARVTNVMIEGLKSKIRTAMKRACRFK
jgi:hypothetical protein